MSLPRKLYISMIIIGLFVSISYGLDFNRVLRVKDGEIMDFDQMLQEMKGYQIIIVGEKHDEPEHHKNQLQIINALYGQSIPVAVGLEMFTADNQDILDDWISGELTLREFLPFYYDNWSMPWPLYRDIFSFAREKRIPLIGLNVPAEITDKVARSGFSSLNEEEMAKLPPGISCDVDATYMEFIKRVYSAHNHATGKGFTNFCEAQMVWDNAMASYTLKFLEQRPQHTVIILAGIGHAWKRALPERIKRLNRDYNLSVVMPEIPDRAERNRINADDADFLILK